MLSKNNLNISNGVKIIFDLDYTLLDTAKFKEKMADIFNKEDFEADYEKYFKSEGINFDFEKYLDILKSQGRIDSEREKELRLKMGELTRNMDNYLYPKVENVLKHFKESGAELILITFGDKKWQEEKVRNLSITKYFDKIIFEEKDKGQSEYLRSLGETNEKILIINDNPSEAEEMLKVLKRGELYLVKGPYNKENKPQINELSDLIPQEKKTKEFNLR